MLVPLRKDFLNLVQNGLHAFTGTMVITEPCLYEYTTLSVSHHQGPNTNGMIFTYNTKYPKHSLKLAKGVQTRSIIGQKFS